MILGFLPNPFFIGTFYTLFAFVLSNSRLNNDKGGENTFNGFSCFRVKYCGP